MTDDTERLAARQAGLASWKNESVANLMDWAVTVGVDPQAMLENPWSGIAPVEKMLRDEDLSTLDRDQRNWLTSRLLVHVAAILAQANGGGWAVDDDPESPSYTRYVIESDGRRFDPGQAVINYFMDPPGRSLVQRISDAEAAAT